VLHQPGRTRVLGPLVPLPRLNPRDAVASLAGRPPRFPTPAAAGAAPDTYGLPSRLDGHGGVHRVLLPNGSRAWLVTGYHRVRAALADPRLSLDKRNARGWAGFSLPAALDANLLNLDPPDHTRIRRLVGHAFATRRVDGLRPSIARIADELVDALPASGPGDLIAAYAGPLPVSVICDLLGIPAANRADFRAWTNTMLTASPPDPGAVRDAVARMHGYLTELLAEKRHRPEDDLLTALLAVHDQGDRLTGDELTSLAFLVLFAGYENSVHLIASTTLHLLTHPALLAEVREHLDRLPAVVEETMRLYPPAPVAIRRFPIRDITIDTIDGTRIPAGDTVLLSLAAANRDPTVFTDPNTLDPTRAGDGHLALGHGIHHCLGAGRDRWDRPQQPVGALNLSSCSSPVTLARHQPTTTRGTSRRRTAERLSMPLTGVERAGQPRCLTRDTVGPWLRWQFVICATAGARFSIASPPGRH
jgi:cytochrome P450